MLRAMKEQLVFLAKEDRGRFHQALALKIGDKASPELEERLKRIILRMPDFITRIHYFWKTAESDSKVKVIGGYILMNLYSPSNLVSKSEWKLFGYLDDAYLVAKFFTTVVDQLRSNDVLSGEDHLLYDEAKFLKVAVREVLPQESARTDRLIQGLLEGHDSLSFDLINPLTR